MINFKILGTGSYLPEKKETTEDFLNKGANEELVNNLGVYEHRIMGDNETVTDMEVNAALIALEKAGLDPKDIDLIISGTAMNKQVGVPNSNAVQHGIGATRAAAFDIHLACATAIPEIIVAAQFIELKQYRYVLITGSSHLTRVSDPTDPASFIVLGDGAGAAVLGPSDDGSGIISFDMQTKGEYFDYCGIKFKKPKAFTKKIEYHDTPIEKLYFYIGNVDDSSSGINKYLLTSVPTTVKKALEKADITVDDIDHFISHQNIIPLSGKWVKLLGIPDEKVYMTYSKYGNMTSANIFVNLDEAVQMDKIKKGDIVVFAGQGAGFSVGSIVMRW